MEGTKELQTVVSVAPAEMEDTRQESFVGLAGDLSGDKRNAAKDIRLGGYYASTAWSESEMKTLIPGLSGEG